MDKNSVYLVQTDTTVGFSSSNDEKLSKIKQRPLSQKMLQTVDSFSTLNSLIRVPKEHRKRVRNSKKTTFIYPNLKSFRVIKKDGAFYDFMKKVGTLYSTSANLTGTKFDEKFALENCDTEVLTKDGFSEKISSSIYKLNKRKLKKIR
ncbi:Sua5 YciO YrdC YwlC family protein [Halarcobacter ebronensis]|uniref:Sua5 YciO YrdC YwlC family protein n=1 Tax=Halarcobacter ebronensis TaxID=1462615 RepID=A0A4Q0YCX8_9BACT|nr:Sua5 YciO YrdC YwlC family protein [Halarcobacter ebronensis]RXJ68287.1 Sua5 YciO YrdC YwlC family protein [Halarcobacter ebronensis]